MTTTTPSLLPSIHSSMAQCVADFGLKGIAKDGLNTFQKFAYRSISGTLSAANQVFAKNKIYCVTNTLDYSEIIIGQDSKGSNIYKVSFNYQVVFYSGIDGSSTPPFTMFGAVDGKDVAKLTGILTSYLMKELLFKAFFIPIEEAEDIDSRDNEGIPLTVRSDLKANKMGVRWVNPPTSLQEAIAWASRMMSVPEEEAKLVLESTEPDKEGKKFGGFVDAVKQIWIKN